MIAHRDDLCIFQWLLVLIISNVQQCTGSDTSLAELLNSHKLHICVPQWSANSKLRWATTLILHILTYALVILTAPLSLFFVLRKVTAIVINTIQELD